MFQIRRGDVLAAWSGIRPLVRDPNAKNSAALSRNHVIETSESGMVTIAGGKWTTYRKMAEVNYSGCEIFYSWFERQLRISVPTKSQGCNILSE